jgi:diaminopimelate epimerase
MKIPFSKAHGAQNDFLLTWQADLPEVPSLNQLAMRICHRNTGIGADGWLLVSEGEEGADIRIRLFNPDGGEVEISGNGTRCAAAWALVNGKVSGGLVKVLTGAGLKTMTLESQAGDAFVFRMDMGLPQVVDGELHTRLEMDGGEMVDCALVHVGNPQCAVFVKDFGFDWAKLGAAIEHHPRFPHRTNVSFVVVNHPHSIDVRFFERGVGVTNSSGTGSTGAMAASVLRGLAESPVTVNTPAGPLQLFWEDSIYLVGPAEIIGTGYFHLKAE